MNALQIIAIIAGSIAGWVIGYALVYPLRRRSQLGHEKRMEQMRLEHEARMERALQEAPGSGAA
jgi:membrane protein YqaA with SNARE-associated domain